jgi:hypothetical protein
MRRAGDDFGRFAGLEARQTGRYRAFHRQNGDAAGPEKPAPVFEEVSSAEFYATGVVVRWALERTVSRASLLDLHSGQHPYGECDFGAFDLGVRRLYMQKFTIFTNCG